MHLSSQILSISGATGGSSSSGRSEISLEGWSHQGPEGAECDKMVGICTRPKQMAYFDVGGTPLRVPEPAKFISK